MFSFIFSLFISLWVNKLDWTELNWTRTFKIYCRRNRAKTVSSVNEFHPCEKSVKHGRSLTIWTGTELIIITENRFSQLHCYTVWSAVGIIVSSVRLSVVLSVCNVVYCGNQGRYRGLKVVPSCSYTRKLSMNFFRHLLLLVDALFSHKTRPKKRTDYNSACAGRFTTES